MSLEQIKELRERVKTFVQPVLNPTGVTPVVLSTPPPADTSQGGGTTVNSSNPRASGPDIIDRREHSERDTGGNSGAEGSVSGRTPNVGYFANATNPERSDNIQSTVNQQPISGANPVVSRPRFDPNPEENARETRAGTGIGNSGSITPPVLVKPVLSSNPIIGVSDRNPILPPTPSRITAPTVTEDMGEKPVSIRKPRTTAKPKTSAQTSTNRRRLIQYAIEGTSIMMGTFRGPHWRLPDGLDLSSVVDPAERVMEEFLPEPVLATIDKYGSLGELGVALGSLFAPAIAAEIQIAKQNGIIRRYTKANGPFTETERRAGVYNPPPAGNQPAPAGESFSVEATGLPVFPIDMPDDTLR